MTAREAFALDLIKEKPDFFSFLTDMESMGISVIRPGQITTREFKQDFSRFFVSMNESGIVTGGHFG